jgi:hypothetical protein
VGAEEDGAAFGPELADEVADLPRGGRVEAAGRLVQEDDGRLVEDGARDREPLLHALGEADDRLVAAVPETDLLERGSDPPAPPGGGHPVQAGVEVEVLDGRQALIQAGRLGEQADARAELVGVDADLGPLDPRPPLAGPDQAGQQPDRRRLAGAVRAEEAEHLAAPHLDREAADRPGIPEPLPELLRPDHRRAAHLCMEAL